MYGRERKQHTYLCCDYGRAYGKEAAAQIDGHGQWLYLREDYLLPLVEEFFAQRIFGPMRLQKLAEQLRSQQRSNRQSSATDQRKLRERITDLDRRIGLQLNALDKGIEPELIGERIAQLRAQKDEIESRLRNLPLEDEREQTNDLEAALARLPDLTRALREAPLPLKRQIFDAFELRIVYDKLSRRIEISANRKRSGRDHAPERERPPEGGRERHSEGHSGGPIGP